MPYPALSSYPYLHQSSSRTAHSSTFIIRQRYKHTVNQCANAGTSLAPVPHFAKRPPSIRAVYRAMPTLHALSSPGAFSTRLEFARAVSGTLRPFTPTLSPLHAAGPGHLVSDVNARAELSISEPADEPAITPSLCPSLLSRVLMSLYRRYTPCRPYTQPSDPTQRSPRG